MGKTYYGNVNSFFNRYGGENNVEFEDDSDNDDNVSVASSPEDNETSQGEKASIDKVLQKINNLEKQQETLTKTNVNLKNAYSDLHKRFMETKEELRGLKITNEELNNNFGNLKEKNEKLSEEVENLQNANTKLKTQLDQTEQQTTKNSNDVDELKRKYNEALTTIGNKMRELITANNDFLKEHKLPNVDGDISGGTIKPLDISMFLMETSDNGNQNVYRGGNAHKKLEMLLGGFYNRFSNNSRQSDDESVDESDVDMSPETQHGGESYLWDDESDWDYESG